MSAVFRYVPGGIKVYRIYDKGFRLGNGDVCSSRYHHRVFLHRKSGDRTADLGRGCQRDFSDWANALVSGLHVPELCLPVVQSMAGILYSMDGSGFAGLTVIGEIAQSYHVSGECAKILTSLGQIVIIWVGGGTVIPWAVIPVSAICGVSPRELAKEGTHPGSAAGLSARSCVL